MRSATWLLIFHDTKHQSKCYKGYTLLHWGVQQSGELQYMSHAVPSLGHDHFLGINFNQHLKDIVELGN